MEWEDTSDLSSDAVRRRVSSTLSRTKEKVALPLLTTPQTAAKWRSKFNRQLIPNADEGQNSDGQVKKTVVIHKV